MKFHFNEIILWLRSGKKRHLRFLPNKVNIITGESSTGKTAILDIIDYCLFSSNPKISEGMINENVLWYGINIKINDKHYTIARKALEMGKASDKYYFSSIGDIPEFVAENNSESSIKSVIESEFSINSDVKVSYGGNCIKSGTKISLRYFFLFNTISANIIDNHSDVFFDKQTDDRYREALPRIFDIAVGIETIENVLKKEKLSELERELYSLNRKKAYIETKIDDFNKEKQSIVKTAKEYGLINESLNFDESLVKLSLIIEDYHKITTESTTNYKRETIESEINLKTQMIRNLNSFSSGYKKYKSMMSHIGDSLQPIEYLRSKDADLLRTSIFEEILSDYYDQLLIIKSAVKTKTPIDNQVSDLIVKLTKQIESLNTELSISIEKNRVFESEKEKILYLGELKAKLELYSVSKNPIIDDVDTLIENIKKKIELIEIVDTTERKDLTIKMIEEIISDYISDAGTALENYSDYKPVFDYSNKKLKLRRPKTSFIENVGSSSNHMFLHLFFTLAIQEAGFRNNSLFMAPFLIIDQPSRPYYGEENERKDIIDHSDEFKISKAFKLLDSFIENRVNSKGDFQMIVFEHIPTRIIKDMKNINVVEEFRNRNALINSQDL